MATGKWEAIVEWLNKHEKEFVVYVAMGTETKLSRECITKLALGLELFGSPIPQLGCQMDSRTEPKTVKLFG